MSITIAIAYIRSIPQLSLQISDGREGHTPCATLFVSRACINAVPQGVLPLTPTDQNARLELQRVQSCNEKDE